MTKTKTTTTLRQPPATALRSAPALCALTFVTFVIGTAELSVVGILDLIARDTSVSVSTAGSLVTAYALGIAIGAPVIATITARVAARAVLRTSLIVFLAGNVLAVAATSFELLLAARVLTGSLHGVAAGVATGIAASIVAPDRRGQAISMVVGGITVSTIVGVPIGTLIGQALGWRAAFVAVLVLGALALVGTMQLVPPIAPRRGAARVDLRAAFTLRVLSVLTVGVLLCSGQFVAFTYLTPFLADVTGISGGWISVFLLAYGVAATAGTLLGGRAADRSVTGTMVIATAVLVAALGTLYVVGANPILAALALAGWGLAGFAIPPALLLRAMTLAGDAANQAATLGISAFNAGIAAGSLVGGAVLSEHGPRATVPVAAVVVLLALPGVWATRYLRSPAPSATHARTGPTAGRGDEVGFSSPASALRS